MYEAERGLFDLRRQFARHVFFLATHDEGADAGAMTAPDTAPADTGPDAGPSADVPRVVSRYDECTGSAAVPLAAHPDYIAGLNHKKYGRNCCCRC